MANQKSHAFRDELISFIENTLGMTLDAAVNNQNPLFDIAKDFADHYLAHNFSFFMINAHGHTISSDQRYNRRAIYSAVRESILPHVRIFLMCVKKDKSYTPEDFTVEVLRSCDLCSKNLASIFDFNKRVVHILPSELLKDILNDFSIIDNLPTEKAECRMQRDDILLRTHKISVPSGKVVIADDLRKYLIDRDDEDNQIQEFLSTSPAMKDVIGDNGKPFSVSSIDIAFGRYVYEKFYASRNIGVSLIGNSSPSVFKHQDGHYLSFRTDFDEIEIECECEFDGEEDEEEFMDCECGAEEPYDHDMHQYPDSFNIKKEELVGQVITDLWAIMVADYAMMETEMKKRGFDIEEELRNNPSLFMVEMEEGDYELKNYYEVYDGDGYDAQVYATLFKV